jgi:DNA polymerase-3 subunit gamma/tau
MSLALKYRPQTFEEVFGNSELIYAIKRLLDKEEIPQTFILQGERGCGKTTLARIIAQELGGEGDTKEMNLADMRGIDTARRLVERSNYAPLRGSSKVYILDEVHMATKEFQNTMLKKLEEPPESVYFILCTTNPDKLISTVKSRCALRKHFVKSITRKEMFTLISRVLKKEKVTWEKEHIRTMAKLSAGVPREALILLDEFIDLEGDDLEEELNKVSTSHKELPIELARALYRKENWKVIASILKGIEADAEDVRYLILDWMRKALLDRPNDYIALIIECFEDSFSESKNAGLALACYKVIVGNN